ncbi:M20 family metallopeptidase [Geosporobacter ferrireducens]|uniref:Peptidase M20 dimerisation domain-containing protein n=1 Tax=Geosporobacter ferrireducens TaxID=1424294 RepID=A0A1D8GME4_9FIRM|nr:M20 family metallopeptidase [Geosporobacter ferrireducens]AOT72065.1 hypothetical protein Gferi_22520 [Geosporobacter ferrireducens]MTI55950.1 M20 family metallopeptidase [Geosporobacter ferrireducens]
MNQRILDAMESCGINQAAIIETWKQMVEIESYTHNPEGVYNICRYIKDKLEELGLKTTICDFEGVGPSLIGTCGEGDIGEGIILAGHMDTVFKDGFALHNPFRIEKNLVFGPGVLDMKGGINLIFYILKVLKALDYNKPIKVIISGDEEHGHAKSRCGDFITREAKGYKAAFNMETGLIDNGIVTARKGMIFCTIKTKGLSAHAGNNFSEGISAIYEIANKILEIQKLNEKYENTTFNVGLIHGGTMVNAVPEYAELKLDIRFVDDKIIEAVKTDLNKIAASNRIEGATSELVIENIFPAFGNQYNKEFYELVKSISINNGLGEPKCVLLGGASDAAYISKAGVPCLCGMGVKGKWNHTDREYAIIDSVMERILLIVNSILELENRELISIGKN